MDYEKPEEATGPCAGFRVLEFGTMVSGPLAGQNLGDLGADVIKIETMMGDTARWTGQPVRDGLNGFFTQFNRNKRAISVDLKSEAGLAVVRKLAKTCDVIIVNYRPGVMDRLGLGYEELSKDNPGLVYTCVSGYGPDGPYSDRPVYDLVTQGMSGIAHMQGTDGKPRLIQSVMADKSAAIAAASAVLAALLARERNGGEGQLIHVPMVNAFAQLTLPDAMTTEAFQPKSGEGSVIPRIFHVWSCADGFLVGMPIEDKQFAGLCKALGREDLAQDERFTEITNRLVHTDAMIELIDEELSKWNWRDALEQLQKHDVPFAPVYDLQDFMDDPQVKHNQTVFDAEDPKGGTTRYVRHPGIFEKTPTSLRRHAPRYGEHTDEILMEAGFDAAQIAEWRDAKLIG